MDLEKKYSMLTKHYNFNDLFPHVGYAESNSGDTFFLLEDGELGMAWISNPLSGASEKTINALSQALQLYTWKENSMVQISLVASNYIDPIIQKHDELHNNFEEMASKMTKARMSFWSDGTKSPIEKYQGTLARDFYLVISAKMPIKGVVPSPDEEEEFNEHFLKFTSTLKSAGLSMTPLNTRGLSFIFNMILNPEKVNKQWGDNFKYDESKPLRHHFLEPGGHVKVHKDHININDNYVSVMTVKNLPKEFSLSDMRRIAGDIDAGDKVFSGNFIFTQNIHIFDFGKLRENLEAKRKVNQTQSFGPTAKWFPSIGKKKEEFDSLFEELEEGDKPVKSYLSVILIENTKKELDERIQFATTYFKDYIGIGFLPDRYFTLPIFLDSLPLCANPRIALELQRYKTMSCSQTVNFSPIISDWKGTGTPSVMLVSRGGQVISFDPFDSKKSKNGAIFAESGSGKSFLANYMLESEHCKDNSKTFVVDVGGSYKKLCSVLGGEFIDFDPKTNFVLNPFEAVSKDDIQSGDEFGDDEDEALVINILCSIIEMMASKVSSTGDVKETLNAKQSSVLIELVTNLYREMKGRATIDELVVRLKAHPDKEIQDISYRLYSFTSESATGKFFNGKSTVSISDAKMTVLDLKHIEGMGPQVMGVVLFMMMSMIADYSYRSDQSVRKSIYVDEAWGVLKKAPEEVVAFLESFYRRIRKSNGSVFIITQSIEDLFESSAGVAIANNSPNKIYLGQDEASLNRSIKNGYVQFSDYQRTLIASTVNQKPHYSEMFIDAGDSGWGVARLIVDRYHSLLYSTEGDEVQMMDSFYAKGVSYHEAILLFMDKEGSLKGDLLNEFEELLETNSVFHDIANY